MQAHIKEDQSFVFDDQEFDDEVDMGWNDMLYQVIFSISRPI